MNIDYGNSIKTVYKNQGLSANCLITGVTIGGQFLPVDLVRKIYSMINKPDRNKCKYKINENNYNFYIFYGDYDDFVNKLQQHKDYLRIGGHGKDYHIDYTYDDDIRDIRIGNYVVDKGEYLEIYTKDQFENKFIWK